MECRETAGTEGPDQKLFAYYQEAIAGTVAE